MAEYERDCSSYFEISNPNFCITFHFAVKQIVIVKHSFHLFPHSLVSCIYP